MRTPYLAQVRVTTVALIGLLALAPVAIAAPAPDQYTEGIPTAKGPKSTSHAVEHGGGAAKIPPQTRSQLAQSKNGAAAANAAKLSAPGGSAAIGSAAVGSAASDTSDTGSGMGLLLPLILGATLAVAIGIFLARRRPGATPAD
jgi:hypothetical protein